MSFSDSKMAYEDSLKQIIDKFNKLVDELQVGIEPYATLKEYLTDLSGGFKGSVNTDKSGKSITHNFGNMDYEVVITAGSNVNTWHRKGINSVDVYASDVARVDYIITPTTNVLRLLQESAGVQRVVMESPPTVGTWEQGELVWNKLPVPGANIGWVCTKSGTFGTSTEPVFNSWGFINDIN
ncbi:hypothetical protein D3C74_50900 [compost metagenome]